MDASGPTKLTKMNPTSEELKTYFQTKREEELFQELELLEHEKIMADIRIEDLKEEVAHWKSNHDNQVKLKTQPMDRPDLKDRAASIQKLQDKISEQNKLIGEFMQLAKNSISCVKILKNRIEELETQNKILIETGHWIGQDEAHDLKTEVEEFLASMRWENNWVASSESINKLRDALNNCNPHRGSNFNDFLKEDCGMSDEEINSPPKHTEPPNNHPIHSPPQEFEHPQKHVD